MINSIVIIAIIIAIIITEHLCHDNDQNNAENNGQNNDKNNDHDNDQNNNDQHPQEGGRAKPAARSKNRERRERLAKVSFNKQPSHRRYPCNHHDDHAVSI